jgi:hypothetical protein
MKGLGLASPSFIIQPIANNGGKAVYAADYW